MPQVVGVRFNGSALPEGTTATDLVLRVVERLREHGVVGKFVEFFGPGLRELPLADRATIANMAPEYGATCGLFGVDEITMDYLRLTGRSEEQLALVEAYCREQGMFWTEESVDATYTDVIEMDLGEIVPSLAGPRRPQDRVALADMAQEFVKVKGEVLANIGREDAADSSVAIERDAETFDVGHGAVVIAAITSCTNTSNPNGDDGGGTARPEGGRARARA